jgi:hypothetical protein
MTGKVDELLEIPSLTGMSRSCLSMVAFTLSKTGSEQRPLCLGKSRSAFLDIFQFSRSRGSV